MSRKKRPIETVKAEPPPERSESLVGLARAIAAHTETSPRLTGGDLDADWAAASATGEEAVGRWHLERDAADAEEGRTRRKRP